MNVGRIALLVSVLVGSSGCAALASRAASGFADNLSLAILNQDDPETVRDGAPAYLLLMDSFVESSPENSTALAGAASLYAAYGAVFVEEPERAKRLTARARLYSGRALCLENDRACAWDGLTFDEFNARLARLRGRDVPFLYTYTVSWLAYIRAHSGDWVALADLPKVEATLARIVDLDPDYEAANVQLYLGVLNTLRPEALGGKPEIGREHFERALVISSGRDLSIKVEYARGYARLVYDRELHDRLLTEVLEAQAQSPGYTLFNTLAQRDARELLASAEEYF